MNPKEVRILTPHSVNTRVKARAPVMEISETIRLCRPDLCNAICASRPEPYPGRTHHLEAYQTARPDRQGQRRRHRARLPRIGLSSIPRAASRKRRFNSYDGVVSPERMPTVVRFLLIVTTHQVSTRARCNSPLPRPTLLISLGGQRLPPQQRRRCEARRNGMLANPSGVPLKLYVPGRAR